MGHEAFYPSSDEFDTNERLNKFLDGAASTPGTGAAPLVSPAELEQLLDEHTTVMFEPGVPGYETSPVIPVPPEARQSLIKEVNRLHAEDSGLETVDTD